MFTVKVGEDEYKVKFNHVNLPLAKSKTQCSILGNGHAFVGIAKVHPGDNYNKNTGRKVSMTYALMFSGLDREERKLFWDAYFQKRGKVD